MLKVNPPVTINECKSRKRCKASCVKDLKGNFGKSYEVAPTPLKSGVFLLGVIIIYIILSPFIIRLGAA